MDATTASAGAVSSLEMIDANSNCSSAVPNGGHTFAPSVWGDFFITYVPPPTKRTEEWMRDRAEELKRIVRRMFEDGGEAIGMAKTVALVDTVERLGLDSHFRQEIAAAISRIHGAGERQREFVVGSNDLHVAATRFRLLRQHGIWVPTDVLDKFRDGSGNFTAALRLNLSSDPRALLSLYNAAHMAVPGEATLTDAIAFARHHLEAMKGELGSPAAEQVARALDHPIPRFTRQLETMRYIAEYEQEETHDGTLLELARINSNLMRSLHLRELKAVSLWWRDLYDGANLQFARDRVVETYFWCSGMIPEEERSRARLMFIKAFALLSIIDDIYDTHATLEECHSFTEATKRWDESAIFDLPESLRGIYMKTLSNFQDFQDLLEPEEEYRMSYAKKAAEYHMKEAQWSNDDEKYQPSFEEHKDLSAMSTGLQMLTLVALMGYDGISTKEVLEWTSSIPDVVRAGCQIGRFLNDISSYKLGENKKEVASAVECYMMEKGVAGEEAVAAITAMTEESWRVVNSACIEVEHTLMPVAQLMASISRTCEVMYLHGRDGYTCGEDVKDLVAAFFLAPIPL